MSRKSSIASLPRSQHSRRPAVPHRDVREQHVHHPDRPTVAGLAALDRDVLGDRGGLVEPALVVPDEGEQPVGPAETAPVTQLTEEVGRLLEPVLGPGDVAVRERDPGQVLQRPRRAPLVARRPERAEGLGDETLGLGEITAEEVRHAEPAQDVRRARLVVELSPQLQRFAERLLGDVVGAGCRFAFAEQRQRDRLLVPIAGFL